MVKAERTAQMFKPTISEICKINSCMPLKTLSRLFFLLQYTTYKTEKTPSEMLFNRKVKTRLDLISLNTDIIKEEQKFIVTKIYQVVNIVSRRPCLDTELPQRR